MKPIDKLLDCQHVKRWSMIATSANSNVASHSFNVAMIAMAIRKKMFNTAHYTEQDVCYYALIHDVDEAETGDMPTPTKMAIRARGVEPNALFETQCMAPKPIEIIQKIIKMADLIDNYCFICEHGVGARARLAESEVQGRLDAALDGAPTDLQAAARWVLSYILERKSDTDEEERIRIEEDRERRRNSDSLVGIIASRILDRKPLNSGGVP